MMPGHIRNWRVMPSACSPVSVVSIATAAAVRGNSPEILTAVYLWVGNLFDESKSWGYLLVQPWLWWGLDPLSGGRARKMGKVSSLCRPEISFESPQITPPLGLTSDALANSAIRQPWTVVDSEFWAPSMAPYFWYFDLETNSTYSSYSTESHHLNI